MIKKFLENVKKYVDYLMTINFGDLFINVIILICILVLSTFVFVPVGLIQSLVRDFIQIFVNVPTVALTIYDWTFNLISTILSFLAFMYMFNKRYEDLDSFKKQIKEAPFKIESDKSDEEDLELPKEKVVKKGER